jgi:RNA-directed DNA polymerase
MSKLAALQACSTVGDLAALLGFKAQTLGYIARGIPDPAKYSSFVIPKRSGGKRTIHAPVPQLKLAQRKLYLLLEECLKEIEMKLGVKKRVAHGFRKGHSIFTNADVHRRQRYVLNFDLEDFFPSINFGRVRGFFIGNAHFKLHPNIALLIAQLSCHEKALPQGSPVSPIISNLIGNILDMRLAKLARASGCAYTRYADDITFSTSALEFPSGIASKTPGSHDWVTSKKISDAVSACGFRIHKSKTRMQHRSSRQDVTGIVVNRHVNVNSDYRRRLRAMVDSLRSTGSFVRKISVLDASGSTKVDEKDGTPAQLQGMLAFAIQAERFRIGSKQPSAELTANERLMRRFLFYTVFGNPDRPVVMFEGKTDGVYLSSAIRRLAASYPDLAAVAGGPAPIHLLRSTSIIERLFGLTGGDDPLKKFVKEYAEEYRYIKGPSGGNPVIAVFDNDSGAKNVLKVIENFYKVPVPVGAQYFHVHGNLYVALTSPAGGPPHCIEDCFDAATLSISLGGKTFSLSKTLAPSEYGKAWFAEKVVKPKESSIDFSGFNGLLATITHIIATHVPAPKPSIKKPALP